jgi:uncharacterized protein
MLTTLAKNETHILIEGPQGKLEMAVGTPEKTAHGAWGIVCHPHPMFGGTMHNKVVTTLIKVFNHFGLSTVRFNFRGVGQSEGEYDKGNGELDDLLTVMNWVLSQRMNQEIWLAGFSFGAYVALRAATQREEVKKLVTIAPPVENFPMLNLPPVTVPWILVQGEQDDVVPPEKVLAWAESRDPKPHIIRFPDAGHFFHGQLQELRTQIEAALTVTS